MVEGRESRICHHEKFWRAGVTDICAHVKFGWMPGWWEWLAMWVHIALGECLDLVGNKEGTLNYFHHKLVCNVLSMILNWKSARSREITISMLMILFLATMTCITRCITENWILLKKKILFIVIVISKIYRLQTT